MSSKTPDSEQTRRDDALRVLHTLLPGRYRPSGPPERRPTNESTTGLSRGSTASAPSSSVPLTHTADYQWTREPCISTSPATRVQKITREDVQWAEDSYGRTASTTRRGAFSQGRYPRDLSFMGEDCTTNYKLDPPFAQHTLPFNDGSMIEGNPSCSRAGYTAFPTQMGPQAPSEKHEATTDVAETGQESDGGFAGQWECTPGEGYWGDMNMDQMHTPTWWR